jgi:exonuclease III
MERGVDLKNLIVVPITDLPETIVKSPTVESSLTTSKLTLGVLNAQSVRQKVNIVRDAIIENDIDILAITETWLTSKTKDELFVKALSISGFKLFSVPRKGNNGYGGIAILYKANLSVSKTSSMLGGETFEHGEILFRSDSKCLNVVVIYRPPPSRKNKFSTPVP